MIRLFILLALLLSCHLVVAIDNDDTDEHWESFKNKYNKTYASPEEEGEARDNFEENLLHVALHNMKDDEDYDKDLHEYSDSDSKEQIAVMCQTEVPDDVESRAFEDFSTSERALPSSVDWVTKGKVTAVKDQGGCGSCWTFSAAQAMEGGYAIRYNKLVSLSEQQLVDCAGDYGNDGCDGGWPQNGFDYVEDKGGLTTDDCYPYTEEDDTCYDDELGDGCMHVKITGYQNVGPAGDENAVAKALAEKGPLTCAIYVSNDFFHYGGGIFTDKTYKKQDVNHGVLLVGYGTENGKDYWKIKNSWGPSWGEDGYIRIRRNYKNHLKVASYTSYPIME